MIAPPRGGRTAAPRPPPRIVAGGGGRRRRLPPGRGPDLRLVLVLGGAIVVVLRGRPAAVVLRPIAAAILTGGDGLRLPVVVVLRLPVVIFRILIGRRRGRRGGPLLVVDRTAQAELLRGRPVPRDGEERSLPISSRSRSPARSFLPLPPPGPPVPLAAIMPPERGSLSPLPRLDGFPLRRPEDLSPRRPVSFGRRSALGAGAGARRNRRAQCRWLTFLRQCVARSRRAVGNIKDVEAYLRGN